MTTWKLMDELGGHRVAVIHKGTGVDPWDVVVDLGDQSFPAQLPATVLTEVLPPEPTELGWYLGTIGEKESVIWRNEQGWRLRDSASIDSWKQLHEDFPGITLVRLGHVFLHAHSSFITPHRAREKAYALLTAADGADRRVSDATP